MSNAYEREIAFLNRKLPHIKPEIKWQKRELINQILSPVQGDVHDILNHLHNALRAKAQNRVHDIAKIVNGINGPRIAIIVPILREFFSNEIDGFSGGGGPKEKPLNTTMRRR